MEVTQDKVIDVSSNATSPAEAVPRMSSGRRARVFSIVLAVTCAVVLSFVGGFLSAYFTTPRATREVYRDSDEEFQGTFQTEDPSDDNRTTTVDFTVKNTPSGQPNNFSVAVVVNSDKRFTFEYDQGNEQLYINGGDHHLTASERVTLEGELLQFLMSDLYRSHDLPPCCLDAEDNEEGPQLVTEDNGEPEHVEQVSAEECNCTSTNAQRELNKKVLLKVIELLAVSPGIGFGQRTYNLTDGTLARRKLQGYNWHDSSRCLTAGRRYTGYFTDYGLYRRDGEKHSWRHTVGGRQCIGRCGSGCNCNWWFCDDDYMQDCFDHDLCLKYQRRENRKYSNYGDDKHCGDEWWEAVDDWFLTMDDYC